VTDLVKEKLLEDLTDLNRWFSEVKAALGLSPKADKGRVLASLVRLCEEREQDKEQQQLVASYCGYKFWGDLVAAAVKAGEGLVVAVKLEEDYLEPPYDWGWGPGKSYDKAMKELGSVQKLVRKVKALIERKREEEGDEWADNCNAEVLKAYKESKDPNLLKDELWTYLNGVEPEQDPSEVWLQAAEESRGALELSTKLPPVAVKELLDYAEEQGVEVSKQGAEVKEGSSNPASFWFDYLFTACVTATLRPDGKSVFDVTARLQDAATAGGLTSLEKAAGSGLQETVWDPTATLADLLTAYKVYGEATAEENASWNYVNDTVREALGKAPVETN
jgi:hypothetical protein